MFTKTEKLQAAKNREAEFYNLAGIIGSYNLTDREMLLLLHRFIANRTFGSIAKDYECTPQACSHAYQHAINKIRIG